VVDKWRPWPGRWSIVSLGENHKWKNTIGTYGNSLVEWLRREATLGNLVALKHDEVGTMVLGSLWAKVTEKRRLGFSYKNAGTRSSTKNNISPLNHEVPNAQPKQLFFKKHVSATIQQIRSPAWIYRSGTPRTSGTYRAPWNRHRLSKASSPSKRIGPEVLQPPTGYSSRPVDQQLPWKTDYPIYTSCDCGNALEWDTRNDSRRKLFRCKHFTWSVPDL